MPATPWSRRLCDNTLGNSLIAAILGALGNGLQFGGDGAVGFARAVQLDCLDRESRGAIYTALTRIRLAQ